MIDLKEKQKEIYQHKIKQGFNVTNIEQEFCLIHEELSEAYNSYRKKLPDVGEELADVAIFLLSLSEILKVDLEQEILNKMKKNKNRVYKKNNKGVLVKVSEEEKEKKF